MTSTATAARPKRIQRKRSPGFRLPPNTLCVTRPGPHGNQFRVGMWFRNVTGDWYIWTHGDYPGFGDQQVRDLAHSLELFRDYATHRARRDPQWLQPVRDSDFIACWCKEDATCHGDILIELAYQ